MNTMKKALSVLLCALLVFSLGACVKYQTNYIEVNGASYPYVSGTASNPAQSSSYYYVPSDTAPSSSYVPVVNSETTLPDASQPTAPSEVPSGGASEQTTETPAVKTPETWSKAEVVQYLGNAVNKTKAYTNDILVKHSESFTIEIEEIKPNFAALKTMAQNIINSVLKPTDDTVTFSNGRGVIGEGEEVPLLLPKRQNFVLPPEGAATATARQDGKNIIIDVTLVSEDATLDQHPVYNAGTTGYLDAGDIDLSMLTLEAFNVTYTGSTIHAVINENGYVSYADYHMPVKLFAQGKALGFTGSFKGSAEQQEQWTLNW